MDRVRVLGRRSRRWGAVAAVLVVGVVVSACGSTVQVSGEEGLSVLSRGGSELGVGGVDGSQSGPDGATAQVPGAADGDGKSAESGSPGGRGGSSSAPRAAESSKGKGSRAPRPAGTGKGPAGSAPGVTDKTIKVGVYTIKGFGEAASAIGASISTGDQEVQAQAVIDYINGKGGVAGRKIVPVFHDFNMANIDNPSQEYQAACSAWTEDNRVYAVATVIATFNDNLYACLAKKGVITSATGDLKDARFFAQFADFFYMPTEINLTRALRNNVDALHAGGYFGKWDNLNGRSGSMPVKIGVVRGDTVVDQRAVNDGLKPALAARGLSVTEEAAVPTGTSGTSAYSSAVLRFKQQNITHVFFGGLGSPLLFGQNAENQQYRPRYGLHSRTSPGSFLQSNMSASQLRGSMGLGWNQYNDVDSRRDPGPASDRASLCLKLMKQAGENTSARGTALSALWVCDSIFFIQDALKRAPDFSPAGFRAGAEVVKSYEAASTFRSGFARGKLHDGAKAYRLFAFKDSCKCFTYTSKVRSAR